MFYTIIIPSVHKLLGFGISQKLTRRILSLPFWQIILCDLVCLYALQVEPVYKQTDEDINNFVQEYSAIGDLVNEYTGINIASNYNYLMGKAENLHTHTVIFMVVTVIFVLTVAIGSIGRKLDRGIVEGMSIITTLGCCWIAKSSTDLYEMTIRDGATLQAIAWFGRLLGTDIYLMMDLIIRSVWILPLILIIKQFYYHKTLNEYYALVVPQSSFIKRQEENKAEEQSKSPYIGFAIGGIAVIIIAVFVVWQCTKNENVIPTLQQEEVNGITDTTQQHSTQSTSDTYEQRSNAIIQELTTKYGDKIQVDHKYPELSQYCTFRLKGESDYGFPYLLVYDLDKKELKCFDTEALQTINAGEILLTSYHVQPNNINNTLIITGDNGANSIGYTEYVLELNPSDWQIRELCSGGAITKNDDGYIAHRMIMSKFINSNATSEYANIDIYYNLQGELIAPPYNGNTYSLKGRIDNKYSITMQLTMQDNKIYGKYYYDENGSGNYLQLYGGVSDSGDVVLLEFNDKSQQTSNFKGRFTSDSFYGTFVNYKGIEMPFELYLNDGLDTKNNSESVSDNSQKTGYDEKTKEPSLTHDRNPEFPGGMSNLKKYISENIIYPTVAQENGISGNVRVSYIINEDGSISDVKVIESIDPYLDKEAVRVISSMPKWSPGIKDGQYVSMRTSSLVKFVLK